jgi:hypothetical protein
MWVSFSRYWPRKAVSATKLDRKGKIQATWKTDPTPNQSVMTPASTAPRAVVKFAIEVCRPSPTPRRRWGSETPRKERPSGPPATDMPELSR